MHYVAEKLPAVAEDLETAQADILAFTELPNDLWAQIWSNNPNLRLDREIRRRTYSEGIFPTRDAIIRLAGRLMVEQTDEQAEARRYLGFDVHARSRMRILAEHRGRGGLRYDHGSQGLNEERPLNHLRET